METRSRQNAFTLVDLLVVIAIIAVLAAILFPVFAKAREKAGQRTCLSNERQLGLGLLQYQQDYNGYFPHGILPRRAPFQGIGWAGEIYPYVKSTGVYHCPDDPIVQNDVAGVTLYPVSYALNMGVVDDNHPTPFSKFDRPAKTVMLDEVQGAVGVNVTDPQENGSPAKSPIDFSDNLVWADAGNNPICCHASVWKYATGRMADVNHDKDSLDNDPAKSGGMEVPGPRHSGGANWLMADGHAEWLRGTAVATRYKPYHWQPDTTHPTVRAWMWPK